LSARTREGSGVGVSTGRAATTSPCLVRVTRTNAIVEQRSTYCAYGHTPLLFSMFPPTASRRPRTTKGPRLRNPIPGGTAAVGADRIVSQRLRGPTTKKATHHPDIPPPSSPLHTTTLTTRCKAARKPPPKGTAIAPRRTGDAG